MTEIKRLFNKYKELINYAFWGVFATITNIVVYYLCYDLSHLSNSISTIIAWIASVLVAFITNKLWVFNSRNSSWQKTLCEFVSFTGFRLLSGVLDLGIMIWSVDMMHMNAMVWKIISNVVVIALNYVFSKFIIFKKPADDAASPTHS